MQPSEMHALRAEMHGKTPVKTSFLLFCSCACTKWTEMRTVRIHTAWAMQWCAEWPPTRHSRKIDGHFRAVCRLQSVVCRLESARCSLHGARCSSDRAQFAVPIVAKNAVAIVAALCRTTAETTNVGAASARVASARRTCVQDRVCAPLRALCFASPIAALCISDGRYVHLAVCTLHFESCGLHFRALRFLFREAFPRGLTVSRDAFSRANCAGSCASRGELAKGTSTTVSYLHGLIAPS